MIHVFFNIDDNYIKQCRTVIASILANTKSKVCFHIIGVDDIGIKGNIRYYKAPDLSILTHTVQVAHITMTSTYRLFAPFILPVDKVIYLDCDLIVLDDIKKLWNADTKYIAGVQDPLSKMQAQKNKLTHTYINTGVLVMNLKNLRKLDYIERIKKTQNGNYNLSLLDQDIINIAFGKEIGLLSENWNVYAKDYAQMSEKMLEVRKTPSIIHWCGWQKPWKDNVWNKDKWSKYMKAIVLTYAPITKEETELLKNTDIFKIATNYSAAELKPNARLTADNIVDKCLECDNIPVVSLNYDLDKKGVVNACTMPKRHSSLLSCIDYLYFQGYNNILLVASNPENTATFKINYNGINDIKECLNLYKYTREGNFDIPYKSIKDFIMLTDEEKLLGITEKHPKKIMEATIFTDSCRYEIWTEGKDNKSIESGEIIKNIIPLNVRERFLAGETEIVYNGMCVKMLTEFRAVEAPKVEEPKEEVKPAKKVVKKAIKKKVKKG